MSETAPSLANRLLPLAALAAIAYGGICLLMYLLQRQLLYYPTVTREAFRHQGRIPTLLETGKLTRDLGLPAISPENDRFMLVEKVNGDELAVRTDPRTRRE